MRMLSIYGHKWSSHLGVADDGTGALTDAAKTWQKGLAGITVEQIKHGFDVLIFKNHDWPPSLPEFRELCLSKSVDNAPTLDYVVLNLVMVSTRKGSVATRYRHPLALAVSMHDGVDMFALRTAKLVDAKRMIKPAYEHCLKNGWNGWSDGDLKEVDSEQKSLGHDKPRDKAIGVSAFRDIRAAL